MTYESIQEAFQWLNNPYCEAIHSNHGYAVLKYDDKIQDYLAVVLARTPKELEQILADSHESYLRAKSHKPIKDLSKKECGEIDKVLQEFYRRCEST